MARAGKTSARPPLAGRGAKTKPPGVKVSRRSPEGHGQALLHELQGHQTELELQNEELRSARLETERALASYTELFDFAPIGYATIAPDHAICEINHVGAQLLGRERERLRGWRFELLVEALEQSKFQALLTSAELTGCRQSCEITLNTDAKQVVVRLSASVLQGAESLALLAFEDISERRQREKLELTERALRDADRRKDDFLATLSHELRNPLAPIRNSVFVLRHAAPGSEAAAQAQLIIDRQVTHLTRLVDDLLDVTRIARGKIQLQREHLEFGPLLRRTVDDHRTSFEELGVELGISVASVAVWVSADPARLVQIISNLLGNALKFTPRGGRVEVYLSHLGEAVALRVVDTGVGISLGVLEHVFEPFAQAPQTLDRARGGLGLGLAMVNGLVELHGGNVAIHSDGPGQGTEVTVMLPLIARTAPLPASEVEPVPKSRRAWRVLMIDDNLDAARTLQLALTLNGHEVKIVRDGIRGLEVAVAFEPEVVICDIGLPGMDGYAVARAFRAHQKLQDTLLVALSGYAQPEDVQRAHEAGFDCHVAKPSDPDTLEQLLTKSLPPRAPGS